MNVLVIAIDTLGAEHSGFLKPGLANTPNLRAVAEEGTLFRRAYSTAPWTSPAVASLFTGRMPHAHGVTNPNRGLAPSLPTLAERLRERGFRTAGIVSNPLIGRSYGFSRGFDDFDESTAGGPRVISSEAVTDRALEWLGDGSSERFFLFLHYFDPHYLFHHHADFDRTSGYRGELTSGMVVWDLRRIRASLTEEDIAYLVGLHHEEIAYTDHHIGRVLDRLRALGVYEDTLVIVLSDHGEEFMRHGWIGHTRTLYEELLHVPMIIRVGDRLEPGVVDTPVSILDVVPTLSALSRKPWTSPAWDGVSLLPQLLGEESPGGPRPIFGEVSYRFGQPPHDTNTAFKTSLRVGNRKLIHDLPTDTWELYDLAADPEELRDLGPESPAFMADLKSLLRAWEAARRERTAGTPTQRFEPGAEDIEKLRGLGYVQ